jgi:hypothetical protein
VKRSGRNEPMWVTMYMCIKATLGISLYSYLYLKLAKTFSYYLLNKIGEQECGTGSAWKQSRVGEWQKKYIHI